jgi:pentatricopeptide repeat protein
MTAVFNISAVVEDYACIVDLLGCAGQLEQAEDLIKMMPCQPCTSVWKGLLSACRVHVNMEMGLQKTISEN